MQVFLLAPETDQARLETLRDAIAPWIIRRKVADVWPDFPELETKQVFCEVDDEVAEELLRMDNSMPQNGSGATPEELKEAEAIARKARFAVLHPKLVLPPHPDGTPEEDRVRSN